MSWRTVVITGNAKLDYKMDYMVVRKSDMTSRIYIGEIGMLIIESTAISLTTMLLCELTKHKIKIVFCDEKHNPQSELIPYYGSHDTSAKVRMQTQWSKEVKENIWTEIVSEKIRKQSDHLKENDTLVLAGSIPSSLPNDIYEQIMKKLDRQGIKIIVDATNDLLKKVLPYHPFLIKPNHRELEELFNVKIENKEDLIHYARNLQEQGAINVLVSLGKDGAILVSEDKHVYYCAGAKGKLLNSVGSGDSMVAGFIAGYLKDKKYDEALKLGSACGGATAFSEDLAEASMIQEVYKQLQVEEL